APAEREAPHQLELVIVRDDGLGAHLRGEDRLVCLPDRNGEWLTLFAVIDVTDPDAVFAGSRHNKLAPTHGFALGGGGTDRVPLAFAALRPFGTDAGASYSPCAHGLRGAGPVREITFHAFEPFWLKPEIDRRLIRKSG